MNTVKITSGKFRNQTLATPGGKTHPMGAREKLALFNMISGFLPDTKVLDAFAGSGALGLEALSRGAREVVFIEKNAAAAQAIRQNLAKIKVQGEIFTGAVRDYQEGTDFDVILADPPYDDFNLPEVSCLVELLKVGGILVLSHPDEVPVIPGVELIKSRQYAAAHISVYLKH